MKNKVFVNKINGKLGNNQVQCEVRDMSDENNTIIEMDSIEDKLNKIFNTNGYIFNIDVKIITDDKIYNTKIASRVGNSIITLDNDIININDIKDIVF